MAKRIGLYGGSFDPIHVGHLTSARSLAAHLALPRVVLIPAPRPPHKQGVRLADAQDRLHMARLAVEGDGLFEVSDIELHRTGPSYTLLTVLAFRNQLGSDAEIYWFIGADSLPELPTWYKIAELVEAATIVTATRPGWQPPSVMLLADSVGEEKARQLLDHCIPTPPVDISATAIRAKVARGEPIDEWVPSAVASYIKVHRLYQE